MNEVRYLRPRSIAEVTDVLARRGGRILAGGTDFFPAQGEKPVTDLVVDLSGIRDLRKIETQSDHYRIGACTTWSQIVAEPLPRCFDALKLAAREVGAIQIQNAGTVGGNLCNASPAADGVPPLLVLDAEVELTSKDGARRLPLQEFITGNRRTLLRPNEILTAVIVPRIRDNARSTFLKLGSRRYMVISIAMVAVTLTTDDAGIITDARVAVGACSPVAKRLPRLEAKLVGVRAAPGLSALALPSDIDALTPIDDVRATASYRMDAALTVVRRALDSCAAGDL